MSMGERVIPNVTISIGLAMFPGHAATRAQLIQAADAALYRAKSAGRNRVVVAESPAPPVDVDFAQAAK
jgi:diguanylate cyclase (GGDEF)-like protein